MAEYDTPAMLSHVMEVTGQDILYYIGHSMGTITYYTACKDSQSYKAHGGVRR